MRGLSSAQTEELKFRVQSRLFDINLNDWLNAETEETTTVHRSSVKTSMVTEGDKRRLTISVKSVPIITLNSDDLKMDGTAYGTDVDTLKSEIDTVLDA